ncbi:MAG: hypothetical protein EXS32_04890 [Opitutus sp.]|nr:hypothetical protein [Opitutus sp.]
MKTPHAAFLPVLLAVALLTGCVSARTTRIQENAGLYASLDPLSKKLINDGLINLGFTSEAVYMSLGRPNHIATTETPEGSMETWTYRNYLYGKTRGITVPPPGSTTMRQTRTSSTPSSANAGISPSGAIPAAPMATEISDAPLATLLLDLRDGRVVAARLEF